MAASKSCISHTPDMLNPIIYEETFKEIRDYLIGAVFNETEKNIFFLHQIEIENALNKVYKILRSEMLLGDRIDNIIYKIYYLLKCSNSKSQIRKEIEALLDREISVKEILDYKISRQEILCPKIMNKVCNDILEEKNHEST